MTHADISKHDPMEVASYLTRRTVMLVVVAIVGPILTSIAILALIDVTNPLDPPTWFSDLIRVIGWAGGVWFIAFLVMSLNSLRHQFWYHNRIDP